MSKLRAISLFFNKNILKLLFNCINVLNTYSMLHGEFMLHGNVFKSEAPMGV
jgi:hypothetical protein